MFRLYDWQCVGCGSVVETVVSFPSGSAPPNIIDLDCKHCERHIDFRRLLSLPAPYMGEKVYNPTVTGGSFDTMGYSPVQTLPDLPSDAESTSDNYKQLWSSKDWQEKRKLQKHQNKQNVEKRKRAAALRRGENINMRRDKCAGDPNIEG